MEDDELDDEGLDEPEQDVGEPEALDDERYDDEVDEDEDGGGEGRLRRAPWHFKILAVGTVIYLGWRLYQGISWLVHHA